MSSPTGPSAPQPYPGPSGPAPYAPQPPKKKRTGLIILLVIVGLVGLLLFGSCVAVLASSLGEPSGTTVKEAEPEASAAASDEPAEKPTEEPSATTYTPKKTDWVLKIKTTDKQCFGSAGCNVSVRVTPLYAGPGSAETDLPDEGIVEITYKLTGDESGPITGTLVVDCADQTAESSDESLSTRRSSTKVKATVTDIEYNEYG